ncbi:cytochrome oxidase putative small subunit CydP [Rhodanobacter sp. BL-MT-08]
MTFAAAFARRPLRRLTVELALVIFAKLAFLMLIWWLIFAPHPKPDASADAIARRLAPSTNPTEAHP